MAMATDARGAQNSKVSPTAMGKDKDKKNAKAQQRKKDAKKRRKKEKKEAQVSGMAINVCAL